MDKNIEFHVDHFDKVQLDENQVTDWYNSWRKERGHLDDLLARLASDIVGSMNCSVRSHEYEGVSFVEMVFFEKHVPVFRALFPKNETNKDRVMFFGERESSMFYASRICNTVRPQ